jgi:hypothetical protein
VPRRCPPATPLLDFQFDEGSGTQVTDNINSLVGNPGDPASPPTFEADAPSSQVGDSAVHFESGQYFVVDDPDTRIQLSQTQPDFTLQAGEVLPGNPAGRIFFYSNGSAVPFRSR